MVTACASESEEELDALAQTAVITDSTYEKAGPYEVVEQLNVGAGFKTIGVDDTVLCKLILPTLVPKATTEPSNPPASSPANPSTGSSSNPPAARPPTQAEIDAELNAFAQYPKTLKPELFSIYRPKTLAANQTYPIILWGNGTCTTPLAYSGLLKHIASYGFVIIAPNSRQVGSGTELVLALKFLESENKKTSSPYYRKLDFTRIGATGHSQGGEAVVQMANDEPRIKTLLPILTSAVPLKPTPTFLLAGTEDPISPPDVIHLAYQDGVGPTWYGLLKGLDHVMPVRNPETIDNVLVAWFLAQLNGDNAAKGWFYGPTCTLCTNPAWTLERKNVP